MEEFTCKTVIKDGIDFGESIDIHDGNLIVKTGSEFVAVPLTVVERIEPDKIYIADFNRNRGKTLGDMWIENAPSSPVFKKMKNLFKKHSIKGNEKKKFNGSDDPFCPEEFSTGGEQAPGKVSYEESDLNSFISKINRTQELKNNLTDVLVYFKRYRRFLEDNFMKKQDDLIKSLVEETMDDLEYKLEDAKVRLTILNFFLREFE